MFTEKNVLPLLLALVLHPQDSLALKSDLIGVAGSPHRKRVAGPKDSQKNVFFALGNENRSMA